MSHHLRQKSQFCATCRQPRLFTSAQNKLTSNELSGQAFLVLATCGLYFPFMVLYMKWQQRKQRFRCSVCGRV